MRFAAGSGWMLEADVCSRQGQIARECGLGRVCSAIDVVRGLTRYTHLRQLCRKAREEDVLRKASC